VTEIPLHLRSLASVVAVWLGGSVGGEAAVAAEVMCVCGEEPKMKWLET
jgi:hypothetical protein